MIHRTCAILYTVAALVSNGQSAPESAPDYALISPCPDFFNYESAEKPGQWTGSLLVQSEEDLHGVWIRLVFDHDVKQVVVDDFEAVFSEENPRDVLVKNRHKLLKAFSPTSLKIKVEYEGKQLPNLVEYRLNAKRVCPSHNALRTDFFEGDADSKNFLSEIQSKSKETLPDQKYKCGTEANQTEQQHPWKATISLNHAQSTKSICDAILISPSYLITAAHCVTFKNEATPIPSDALLVHLGEDLRVKVSNVIVHPGYQAGFLDHDLALLKTTVPLEVTDHVRPICLFENDLKEGHEKYSQLAVLVGKEIEKDGSVGPEVVQAAAFRIEQNECALRDVLAENSYCVSYLPDNKHCVGSSGDGFISSKDGKSTLRGVVTLGILLQGEKECKQNSVSVVEDISKYKKWIQKWIY